METNVIHYGTKCKVTNHEPGVGASRCTLEPSTRTMSSTGPGMEAFSC